MSTKLPKVKFSRLANKQSKGNINSPHKQSWIYLLYNDTYRVSLLNDLYHEL